jgi:hypothetical protein
MFETDKLSLRVDGEEFERVRLQFELELGIPVGPTKVVIEHLLTGPFTLSDSYLVEVRQECGDWQPVTLCYFVTLLQLYQE